MNLCCPFVPFSEPQQVNSFSVKFFCESCTSGFLARLYHSKRCNVLLDTRLVYLEIWFLNKAYKWDKRKFISPPLTERFGCKKAIFLVILDLPCFHCLEMRCERSGFCNRMGMQSLGVCSVGVTKQNGMEAFCTWHQFSCSVRQRPFHWFGGICPFPHRRPSLSPEKREKFLAHSLRTLFAPHLLYRSLSCSFLVAHGRRQATVARLAGDGG
jgi:hypothetical protein